VEAAGRRTRQSPSPETRAKLSASVRRTVIRKNQRIKKALALLAEYEKFGAVIKERRP
jgi:hypothetical protein